MIETEGFAEGVAVGERDGSLLGSREGEEDGFADGSRIGEAVGSMLTVGLRVGEALGDLDGSLLGSLLGSRVGLEEGSRLGSIEGDLDGSLEGSLDGCLDGSEEGCLVGTMLTLGACDTEGKEDTGSKQKSHAKGQASRTFTSFSNVNPHQVSRLTSILLEFFEIHAQSTSTSKLFANSKVGSSSQHAPQDWGHAFRTSGSTQCSTRRDSMNRIHTQERGTPSTSFLKVSLFRHAAAFV
mmetsp:Transcript_8636/g.13025  ORF Transcript_8636/g.13025 Transcript_8636/m.13025 type:complete len:239 (+) Transcript_8636:518-1234(+)